jgi:hypothetical protein
MRSGATDMPNTAVHMHNTPVHMYTQHHAHTAFIAGRHAQRSSPHRPAQRMYTDSWLQAGPAGMYPVDLLHTCVCAGCMLGFSAFQLLHKEMGTATARQVSLRNRATHDCTVAHVASHTETRNKSTCMCAQQRTIHTHVVNCTRNIHSSVQHLTWARTHTGMTQMQRAHARCSVCMQQQKCVTTTPSVHPWLVHKQVLKANGATRTIVVPTCACALIACCLQVPLARFLISSLPACRETAQGWVVCANV